MDALVLEDCVVHKEDIVSGMSQTACARHLAQFQLD